MKPTTIGSALCADLGSIAEHLSETDLVLLQWLTDHYLDEREAQTTTVWWWQERQDDQSLVQFLMSQQILLRTAGNRIEQLHTSLTDSLSELNLMTVHGLEYLREQLRDVVPHMATTIVPEPVQAMKETVPLNRNVRLEPVVTLPEIGMTLGRCLLTEQIGKGASGVVYRALHRSLNVPVAIKILNAAILARDPNLAKQFKSEARLLAQLNHSNVVRVWDFEDSNPFPYLVLEYVEGLSLAELIHQSGRLQPDRALRIIAQTVEGLAAAYKVGIVHRDVKPANILLSRDGIAKIADLGLAMVVDASSERSEARQRGVAGTVAYMAPEQAIPNAAIDFRADIYALGATLYHAITGRLPFACKTRVELLFKHAHELATTPDMICPDIEPRVSALVMRMMAKRPDARFVSHEELREAFAEVEDTLAGRTPVKAKGTPQPISGMWKNLQQRFGQKPTE